MRNISIEDKFIKDFCVHRQAYDKASQDSLSSFTPGEWVTYRRKNEDVLGFGFVNLHVHSGPCFSLVHIGEMEHRSPEELLINKIDIAINYRKVFIDYKKNSRLVYGAADELPGLIIDSYQNCILVQINTAGIDLYRKVIRDYLKGLFPNEGIFFLDNKSYRKNENLPELNEDSSIPDSIEIEELGISYSVSRERMQKVGYYYDHRENRRKLYNLLTNISKPIHKGVDLFSYIGSWGIPSLKAGVKEMVFVDQANFRLDIEKTINENKIQGRFSFEHSDVFKFLENTKEKYNLVISDPPAFSKNAKNIKNALRGYEKLYRLIFPRIESGGLLVVASCTYGVSLEDLDNIISKLSLENRRNAKLLDLGIQGFDHVMNSFKSKSNYIKYLIYYIE